VKERLPSVHQRDIFGHDGLEPQCLKQNIFTHMKIILQHPDTSVKPTYIHTLH